MDRNEFMELVYETFADEPDNVLANGIIEAADAYVEHEKEQLSQEGTTKDATADTISRQAAIDAAKDWYEGLICGSVNGLIKRLNALPSVQPEQCGDKSYTLWKESYEELKRRMDELTSCSDIISRQAALEKVRTMQTYKLFMGDDMILVDKAEVQTELMMLPPAQPEPHEGHWIPHETPDGGEQYECSLCGVLWEFNDGTPEDNEAYFCPKCGKKLITK